MPPHKKLIEVALPLEAINAESSREKSIRHGHPSTLHQWWARRPLAACRAVLFASLVDDPSAHPDKFPSEEAQNKERQRLFRILEELVKWGNVNNKRVMEAARAEILKSTDGNPPPVLDPFCGGGSIPLEAQRLGLKAYGSDLNPVAVLITKALIEIPPRFAGRPPTNPEARKKMANASEWHGAAGLADDVRYYGKWMRDEAEKRIGHLYPKVKLSKEHGGGEATVIAWLWARTVKCPNPACGATMPLVSSFWLSTRTGNQAWVDPIVNKKHKTVQFQVRTGKGAPPASPKVGRGAKFKCLVCGSQSSDQHIKDEGTAGRMGVQLMAIVAEGAKGRIYLSPDEEHSVVALSAKPNAKPTENIPDDARGAFWCKLYGLITQGDLYTSRQLVTLNTLSDLVKEVHSRICKATGDNAYGDAVATYLAFAIDKVANLGSSICSWMSDRGAFRETFARQGIPMVWDFAEANPFSDSGGNIETPIERVADVIDFLPATPDGQTEQLDAGSTLAGVERPLIVTDPPYYDNIGYADLSDFFYVWLRRNLSKFYPNLFSTLLVPKTQELTVSPARFDWDKDKADDHFISGLRKAFQLMNDRAHPDFPVSIFYAFKQTEEEEGENDDGTMLVASTGWETMLEGLLIAGFQITGTWPMRTESPGRAVAKGTNALASSIVLVCRPRAEDAPLATRREFIAALRRELPDALKKLQQGNVAPVDFAQAAIGPGMSVFSRYSKILEADGSPMRVRAALQLINQELEAYFAEQEGDLDADTRFCVSWFEQKGMDEGAFGEADVLARAKNTSVQGLVDAGVLKAKSGKVRLLKRDELDDDWNPIKDARITVWECAQYLIRALHDGGEDAAGKLAAQLGGGRSEDARALAYRLYSICERKGWAQEALAYNTIVASWGEVQAKTATLTASAKQTKLDL